MNAEDTIKAFTDQSQRGSNNSDKKRKEPSWSEGHGAASRRRKAEEQHRPHQQRQGSSPRQPLNFMPPNTLVAKVLMHIRDDPNLQLSERLKSPPHQSSGKILPISPSWTRH
jgi:hypothetical protein